MKHTSRSLPKKNVSMLVKAIKKALTAPAAYKAKTYKKSAPTKRTTKKPSAGKRKVKSAKAKTTTKKRSAKKSPFFLF